MAANQSSASLGGRIGRFSLALAVAAIAVWAVSGARWRLSVAIASLTVWMGMTAGAFVGHWFRSKVPPASAVLADQLGGVLFRVGVPAAGIVYVGLRRPDDVAVVGLVCLLLFPLGLAIDVYGAMAHLRSDSGS